MLGRVGAVVVGILAVGCHRAEPRAEVVAVVDAGPAPVACDRDATVKLATSQIDSDAHDAVETTETFLATCPDDPQVRATKLRAHERLQQWDAALVEANKLVAASPNDAALHAARGDVLVRLGQFEDAVDDYRAALASPALADVPLKLASVYEQQGRECEATKMLKSAIATQSQRDARAPLEAELAKLAVDKPCSAKALRAAKDRAAKLALSDGRATPSGGLGSLGSPSSGGSSRDGLALISYTPGETASTSAVLNGQIRVTMIVDTGASSVAIPRRTAAALGIAIDNLPTGRVQTAGGIRTVWRANLREVRVQGIAARDVPCVILDDRDLGTEGLLGQSFLGRFRTTQDAQRGVIEIAAR